MCNLPAVFNHSRVELVYVYMGKERRVYMVLE